MGHTNKHLQASPVAAMAPWSNSDDALLREGVELLGPKRWRDIASRMFPPPTRRSAIECRARWCTLTRSKALVDKRMWSGGEDELLADLVEEYAQHNWSIIASQIPGRNAKQCRERWHNQIRPDLKHAPWTEPEDTLIVAWQQRIGNKWAKIARELPGRTDNMVKNRWHATLARRGDRATERSSSPSSPQSASSPPLAAEVECHAKLTGVRTRGRVTNDHGPRETELRKKAKTSEPINGDALRSQHARDAMAKRVAHILVEWQRCARRETETCLDGRKICCDATHTP